MLLSVIIPVYNVEKYLYACIESVAHQANDEIEIILVDDGSTDNSYAICMEAMLKFNKVNFRIIRQENRGLSGARNTGLRIAEGEYIIFVDSDDMLQKDAIDTLLMMIKEHQSSDLFFYDTKSISDLDAPFVEEKYNRKGLVDTELMTGEKYFSQFYLSLFIVSACLVMYRLKYLKQNNFYFTEGELHEDISYSLKTLINAPNVKYTGKSLYIRRYRDGSITMQKVTYRNLRGIMKAYHESISILSQVNVINTEVGNAVIKYWEVGITYLIDVCKKSGEDIIILEKLILNIIKEIEKLKANCSGYTYYSVILRILSSAEQNGLHLTHTYNIAELKDIRDRYKKDVIYDMSLTDDTAIYGIGNHTAAMLAVYKEEKNIPNGLIFLDSKVNGNEEKFLDRPVHNINNLPSNINRIIISSFIHHNEMYLICKKKYSKIDVYDIYQTEKIPLDYDMQEDIV